MKKIEEFKDGEENTNKPCKDCGEKSNIKGVNYITCKYYEKTQK